MPPRFAYWTIILDGKPTAFRTLHREELLPTFKQLQNRHPDVVMKWFARGRLWESPEEAQAARQRGAQQRGAGWRPGGEHRDPRARFKVPRDEKRRRFADQRRRERQDPETGARNQSAPPRSPTTPKDRSWPVLSPGTQGLSKPRRDRHESTQRLRSRSGERGVKPGQPERGGSAGSDPQKPFAPGKLRHDSRDRFDHRRKFGAGGRKPGGGRGRGGGGRSS